MSKPESISPDLFVVRVDTLSGRSQPWGAWYSRDAAFADGESVPQRYNPRVERYIAASHIQALVEDIRENGGEEAQWAANHIESLLEESTS